ncbi:MAG: chemotaxis protein CheD [Clostridiales bacterium]|nr:chemotaxis protein CheD [Clostridiales bacterium]
MISVGIGEYVITDSKNESLNTHALGSCVALIIHCTKTKCTAMAHIVLPNQDVNHKRILAKEAYFASDIVPKLIDFFVNRPYCRPEHLQIMLVGGAVSSHATDVFKVGERNVHKIKTILEGYNLDYDATEVLGRFSRSVEIDVKSGEVIIKKKEMHI